jgi:signal transduction histidine kinase
MLSGEAPLQAFLPGLSIVLQVAALSAGQVVAERRGWSRAVSLALAVPASLLFGAATVSLHYTQPGTLSHTLLETTGVGMGVFAFWLLVFYFPPKLHEARLRALAAEAGLQKAELARLRSNLHPHFLLNTLNAIAGLLVAEPRQARQMIVALGDLLRDSLEDNGAMRTLEQEAEWLKRYAGIFEIRHRGAIRFEWDLPDDTLATPLPRLLLQPLLENAIEHGALMRPGGGTVTVGSRTVGGAIRITVSDDGPGMGPVQPRGLGLRLVEDRLGLAYPGATMTIETGQAGTCVTIRLPKKQEAR